MNMLFESSSMTVAPQILCPVEWDRVRCTLKYLSTQVRCGTFLRKVVDYPAADKQTDSWVATRDSRYL